MGKNKLPSTYQTYTKLRKNLMQQMRRMEKSGYSFKERPIFPKAEEIYKPKTSANKYIKQIKETAKNIYSFAEYNYGSGTWTGEEAKHIRASASAKRGARTRQVGQKYKNIANYEQTEGFEDYIKKRDAMFRKRYEEGDSLLAEGNVVYNKILDMIDDVKVGFHSARHLKSVLDSEINQFGFETVMQSMAQTPSDFLETADIALRYKRDSDRHNSAIVHIIELIKGEKATAEELARVVEDTEKDDSEY